MNKWILPIIFFLLFVLLIVGGILTLNRDIYRNVKKQEDCDSTKLCKEADCCVIWDKNMCRKAKIKNGQCVSKGDIVPVTLMILGIICLIVFIVLLIKALVAKN